MHGVMNKTEMAARLALATMQDDDPLPPGPNYGPFGFFRLGILVFAVIVAVLAILAMV